MDTPQNHSGIAGTLLKTTGRMPVTYQDEARIIWGDYNNSWYISLSSVFVKERTLKIEYGNVSVDGECFGIVYRPTDEKYQELCQLFTHTYTIADISAADERFSYVKKVIAIMLFHQLNMKRGSEV